MGVRYFRLDVLLLFVYCGNRFLYLWQMLVNSGFPAMQII